MYKRLEEYPHPDAFKRFFDYLMYFVASTAPLALVPQLLQVYTEKDASGLSLMSWSVLFCLNLLWLIYGILHKEAPVIIANCLFALINGSIVIGIVLYS